MRKKRERKGKNQTQVSAKAALNKAVEDAEVLSDLCKSKSKDQAAKRVLKMIKVIKGVKKQADSEGQKTLGAALAELEKLSKKGTNLKFGKLQGHSLGCSFGNEKGAESAKK